MKVERADPAPQPRDHGRLESVRHPHGASGAWQCRGSRETTRARCRALVWRSDRGGPAGGRGRDSERARRDERRGDDSFVAEGRGDLGRDNRCGRRRVAQRADRALVMHAAVRVSVGAADEQRQYQRPDQQRRAQPEHATHAGQRLARVEVHHAGSMRQSLRPRQPRAQFPATRRAHFVTSADGGLFGYSRVRSIDSLSEGAAFRRERVWSVGKPSWRQRCADDRAWCGRWC